MHSASSCPTPTETPNDAGVEGNIRRGQLSPRADKRASAAVLVALSVSQIIGCRSEPAGGAHNVQMADSAGVPVVFSQNGTWEQPRWELHPEPTTVIGTSERDADPTFYRVGSALRLSTGGFLISETTPPRLRLFDSAGRYRRSIGRHGQGPGEFELLAHVCVHADSVVTYDPALGRITHFSPDGSVVAVYGASRIFGESGTIEGGVAWFDSFSNCELLGRPNRVSAEQPGSASFPFLRNQWHLGRIDTVTVVTGGTWVQRSNGAVRRVPFSGLPWAVAGANTVFVSNNTDYWVREYSKDGNLIRRFGKSHLPSRISGDDRRRLSDAYGTLADYPEYWPAHGPQMVVDLSGHLWLPHFVPPWYEGDKRKWSVFDTLGILIGEVETPAALEVTEIGSNYILGVFTDTMGVESVRLFSLERP